MVKNDRKVFIVEENTFPHTAQMNRKYNHLAYLQRHIAHKKMISETPWRKAVKMQDMLNIPNATLCLLAANRFG